MNTWTFTVEDEDYTLKGDHHPDTDPAEIAEEAAEQYFNDSAPDNYKGWPREFKIFRDGVEMGVFSVDLYWWPSFFARQFSGMGG